ncbi:hypothetical protein ABIB40_003625 [Pedobacter sp. UYP30]|uniref:hypothetical protein n=1 Tax=Pedobacter sp. UYP30 TaxID=1756400 RepID=UPI0033927693
MKNVIAFFCMLSIGGVAVHAQKYVPEIKENTVVTTNATIPSGTFPVVFTFGKMTPGVDLMWSVDGYGDGTFEMSKEAVENATGFSIGQPQLGTTKFDDKTALFISRKAYQDLMSNKMFMYDGLKFTTDTTTHPKFMLNEKEADVSYVKSEDGKVTMTILNNPLIPLTLETHGQETDILITEIR